VPGARLLIILSFTLKENGKLLDALSQTVYAAFDVFVIETGTSTDCPAAAVILTSVSPSENPHCAFTEKEFREISEKTSSINAVPLREVIVGFIVYDKLKKK
jgi:hypothetical protein